MDSWLERDEIKVAQNGLKHVPGLRVSYFFLIFPTFWSLSYFLGGLSLHLNHLIAERVSAPYRQFGTLPIGIFLSNLDSGQLETSLMTSYCHF